MCAHFSKLPLLKCSENVVFFYETTQNKSEKSAFVRKSARFCYAW